MTLRQKLIFRYSLIAGFCLLMLLGLAHHEFVVEPRVRKEMGFPKPSGSTWGEYAEMVFHGTIPVVLGVGWWILLRTLQPIHKFTKAVERVHADNLGEMLPRTGNGDEIDRLTEVFNAMTQRLDRSFQHTREFALHASHELKTPLAIMRAAFEERRMNPSSPQACLECVAAHLDEIQRLARIVDSLTLLSKAEVGLVEIEHEAVPLADLINECFDDAQVLAEQHDVSVTLESCEPVTIVGDRDRLRQLLLNLMDNGIKYNKQAGWLTLSLRRHGDVAEIIVTNTGPGIPPELRERVFDRFVRGQDAREKAANGCGLGLSICQWIVEAHCGTIKISSPSEGLISVTVRLPVF